MANNNKICFITCVNNYEEYSQALAHIHLLNIPAGFEIETIAIENASSLTSGYNKGMKKSDAKYKVYLHQDTYIINKNFITDILQLFLNYPILGMLGVVGALSTPNGYWWYSPYVYGTVYHTFEGKGKIGLINSLKVKKDYQPVRAIDGLIMVTQYDIPWREDIFKGWHFYDVSQSFEFLKAGLEVGVPIQRTPWCIHDCGSDVSMAGYEENRVILIQNYQGIVG